MKHDLTTLFAVSALLVLALLSLFFAVPQIWFWLVIALWIGFVAWGSSRISSQYHLKAHCSGKTHEQVVALTFDDGPSEYTPEVLALLEKHNVKATFFCIGQQLEKHPGMAEKIIAAGHSIGNHSYSHSRFFDFFSTAKIIAELKKTDALVYAQTGKMPRWFRPPYGVTNPAIARAIGHTSHDVLGWNIRSNDGISQNRERIYNRVITRLAPGGVILMHDTSACSVRVLERLLVTLPLLNYHIVPLGEMLNLPVYEA